jgi:hypothetical protein
LGFPVRESAKRVCPITIRHRGRTRSYDRRRFGKFYNVNLDVPAQVRRVGNRLILTQSGSDASAAYYLDIVIRDDKVVSVTPRVAV